MAAARLPPSRPFGGVVRHAQATVVEEARERRPALQTVVVDRLSGLVPGGEPGALLAQKGLELDEERPAALVANALTFRRGQAVDLALSSPDVMSGD
jgi:hypothetical protein